MDSKSCHILSLLIVLLSDPGWVGVVEVEVEEKGWWWFLCQLYGTYSDNNDQIKTT